MTETQMAEIRNIGIGIDIGMTYSGSAIAYNTPSGYFKWFPVPISGESGVTRLPSQAFISAKEQVFGQEAISYKVGGKKGKFYSLFKRRLGTQWSETIEGITFTASSLTSHIIETVQKNTALSLTAEGLQGRPIRCAFSYPGTWKDDKIHDFGEAIKMSGITDYLTIPEPIAAALGAVQVTGNTDLLAVGRDLYICDLGGGTLDLAIVSVKPDSSIIVKAATSGDPNLGMSNLDKILSMLMVQRAGLPISQKVQAIFDNCTVDSRQIDVAWEELTLTEDWKSELLITSEVLKRNICDYYNFNHWGATLPNNQPITLKKEEIQPFIDKTRLKIQSETALYFNELKDRKIAPQSINAVLINGGGAALPGIRESLQAYFSEAEVVPLTHLYSSCLVQIGAAVFASNPDIIKERRCNNSYGVKAFDRKKPDTVSETVETKTVERDGIPTTYYSTFDRFLRRGDTIPEQPIKHSFSPIQDNQSEVIFEIKQGENEDPNQNMTIAIVKLPLPKGAKHDYLVYCFFELRIDGYIHVFARDENLDIKSNEIMIDWQRLSEHFER